MWIDHLGITFSVQRDPTCDQQITDHYQDDEHRTPGSTVYDDEERTIHRRENKPRLPIEPQARIFPDFERYRESSMSQQLMKPSGYGQRLARFFVDSVDIVDVELTPRKYVNSIPEAIKNNLAFDMTGAWSPCTSPS